MAIQFNQQDFASCPVAFEVTIESKNGDVLKRFISVITCLREALLQDALQGCATKPGFDGSLGGVRCFGVRAQHLPHDMPVSELSQFCAARYGGIHVLVSVNVGAASSDEDDAASLIVDKVLQRLHPSIRYTKVDGN